MRNRRFRVMGGGGKGVRRLYIEKGVGETLER